MLAFAAHDPVKTLAVLLIPGANDGAPGSAAPYGAHDSMPLHVKSTTGSLQVIASHTYVPTGNPVLPNTTCFVPVVAALILPNEASRAPGALCVPSSKYTANLIVAPAEEVSTCNATASTMLVEPKYTGKKWTAFFESDCVAVVPMLWVPLKYLLAIVFCQ